jgi:2',3'-cyclic-nucleotide 2'-phosphodiesterase (5'-nucleotidase family)
MFHHANRRKPGVRVVLVLVAMLAALLAVVPAAQADPPDDYGTAAWTLTVLHNNDGESQLVNAGGDLEDYGGAARFKALVDAQRAAAATDGTVMLSSGDNFLAGPEFNLGLKRFNDTGEPMFDTIAMALIGYDSVALGNHDFDFGPDVLADFLSGYQTLPTVPPPPYAGPYVTTPYVAANLDFSGEPSLQAYVDPLGPITSAVDPLKPLAESTVLTVDSETVGIIGLDTPNLATISSPRNVVIDQDTVKVVKDQVAALSAPPYSVDKIILTSHLQDIDLEKALISEVTGVDVVIAGGGDELLANADDELIPGDEEEVFGTYPQWQQDSAGVYVPIVTTSGEYRYLGQLQVGFDAAGKVVGIGPDSGPLVVSNAYGILGLVDTTAGFWRLGANEFYYGNPGDVPFVGDWDLGDGCDGVDTPGLYRQLDGFVYLRNSNTQGVADSTFFFGDPDDVPIAGDFNDDGCDTVSIYRPSNQTFYIINELGEDGGGLGEADFSFVFGDPGDEPFVGDLDGDGIDEVALHRDTTGLVYYRNTLTTGVADVSFIWGNPADAVFAGDWNVDGTDTVGLLRPSDSTFYWRNSNTAGFADGSQVVPGGDTDAPVAGWFGDAAMQHYVVDPVVAGLEVLNSTKVATSEVDLDGLRSSVRSMEANEGNLIADSQLWQATQLAPGFGVEAPDVALQNGGGIRNNTIIPAGDLTVLDTFDMVPFPNFLTVFEDVPVSHFKEILENAVSRVDGLTGGTGRFAQIGGFEMVYDPTAQAQVVDDDGVVLTPGKRIDSVKLDDGTALITGGAVVDALATVNITIVDFLARGGDQYPFRDLEFTVLGVSYQQALQNYLEQIKTVTAADYPEGGEGRITTTP